MKNFILYFLLHFLISGCIGKSNKEIIGDPIKLTNFEVAQFDLNSLKNYEEAKIECTELGNGWRLPNKEELFVIIQNKELIKNLKRFYWSSTEVENDYSMGWVLDSKNIAEMKTYKQRKFYVRAIRPLNFAY